MQIIDRPARQPMNAPDSLAYHMPRCSACPRIRANDCGRPDARYCLQSQQDRRTACIRELVEQRTLDRQVLSGTIFESRSRREDRRLDTEGVAEHPLMGALAE